MSKIKLAGKLPGDALNGLATESVVQGFLTSGGKRTAVLVVGIVSSYQEHTDYDTEEGYPIVRMRHIEVVDGDRAGVIAEVLKQVMEERTGEMTLPFEPGEPILVTDEDGNEGD